MPRPSRKTSTITFRIDQEFEQTLRNDATSQRVSLNTLANQIFGQYCEWDRFLMKFGAITLSREAFRSLLQSLPEDSVKELAAEIGSTQPKAFMLFQSKKIDERAIIRFLKMYLGHCGYGEFDYETRDVTHTFAIRHTLGPRMSLFIRAFVESMLNSVGAKNVQSSSADNEVTVTFTI